mmetsp:Transcript_44026/g.99111  ORF Transcript_44026/g.99111 Transcript_44026/m.99111 type:complete len:295 (+) Transcript_44026:369-1253(+)
MAWSSWNPRPGEADGSRTPRGRIFPSRRLLEIAAGRVCLLGTTPSRLGARAQRVTGSRSRVTLACSRKDRAVCSASRARFALAERRVAGLGESLFSRPEDESWSSRGRTPGDLPRPRVFLPDRPDGEAPNPPRGVDMLDAGPKSRPPGDGAGVDVEPDADGPTPRHSPARGGCGESRGSWIIFLLAGPGTCSSLGAPAPIGDGRLDWNWPPCHCSDWRIGGVALPGFIWPRGAPMEDPSPPTPNGAADPAGDPFTYGEDGWMRGVTGAGLVGIIGRLPPIIGRPGPGPRIGWPP